MNLNIKPCSEEQFNIIKDNFRTAIYDNSAGITSFFMKKKTSYLLKYFSKNNNALCKFFKTTDPIAGFTAQNFQKIDRMVLQIIEANALMFVKDKKFSIYAKRFHLLQTVKYDKEFMCINDSLVRIKKNKLDFFSNTQSYEIKNIFSDESIKKMFTNSKNFLFEKDIFNGLVKYIRSEQGTIDDISVEDLLTSPDKTNVYIKILNEIVEKKLYLRKRQTTEVKSLTKTNAKEVFCNFLNDKTFYFKDYCKDIKDYCEENKINTHSIRTLAFDEYITYIYYYVNINKHWNSHAYKRYADNARLPFWYASSDELLNAMLLNYKFDASKIVNPKKYSHKTKLLFIHNKQNISLLESIRSGFFKILIKMVDSLIENNVNEKIIRTIIQKIIDNKNRYVIKDIKDMNGNVQKAYYLPDMHVWTHDLTGLISKYNKLANFKNTKMVNSFIKLMNAFNINTLNDIQSISLELNSFINNKDKLIKYEDRSFSKLSEFNAFISEIESLELQELLESVSDLYNEESLTISKNMKILKPYIGLLESSRKYIKIKPKSKEVLIIKDKIKIEILDHANPIGLLGAFVRGVCIAGDGDHRKSQLNPDFMNLVIRDDEKIYLWGLLCEGTYQGKKIYVLNNLQGSVEREVKEDVLESIKDALKQFKKENEAEHVFFKKLSFNALHLTGEDMGRIQVSLNKKIRLDFSEEDNFFAL